MGTEPLRREVAFTSPLPLYERERDKEREKDRQTELKIFQSVSQNLSDPDPDGRAWLLQALRDGWGVRDPGWLLNRYTFDLVLTVLVKLNEMERLKELPSIHNRGGYFYAALRNEAT